MGTSRLNTRVPNRIQPPRPVADPGWADKATLDLTGFSASDFIVLGDGLHTIDGIPFRVLHTANADTFELNANGMVLAPKANNGLTASKFDAPLWSIDQAVLLANFDPFGLYRAELGWNDSGIPMGSPVAGSQVLQFGLWNGQAATGHQIACCKTGVSTAVSFTVHKLAQLTGAAEFFDAVPGPKFHLDFCWQNMYSKSRFQDGAFSAFADADTLSAVGEVNFPAIGAPQAISSPHSAEFYGTGRQRLYGGTIRTSASTAAFEARFTDVRIQQFK